MGIAWDRVFILWVVIGIIVAVLRGYAHHLGDGVHIIRFLVATMLWPWVLVNSHAAHHWIVHHIS